MNGDNKKVPEEQAESASNILKEGIMKKDTKKVEHGKATAEIEAERIASRQRAHKAKVAKFLAGGEF